MFVDKGRSCATGRPADGEVVRRGFIRSPNWPGEYPADVDCEWTISSEQSRHVLIVVSRVELAASATWRVTDEHHCSTTNATLGDWLLITDATGSLPSLICNEPVALIDRQTAQASDSGQGALREDD